MRQVAAAAAVVLAGLAILATWPVSTLAAENVPGHGRAWELVTPAEPVGPSVIRTQAINADGSRVVFISALPMPGASGGDLEASNLAIRGAGGWSSSPLGARYSTTAFSLAVLIAVGPPVAFNDDLSTSLWRAAEPLVPGGPAEGQLGLYRLRPDGTITLLADLGDPEVPEESGNFIAASDDTEHVVFSSYAHRLGEDAGRLNGSSIYEIDGATERLVDVDSNGDLLSTCGSTVDPHEGVSGAGKRIFFTNPDPFSPCMQPSHVYLREGGVTTVDVSASQCTRLDCNSASAVRFAGATPSGSSVFLTSTQQLTNSDVDEKSDLYRYDIANKTLTLVSESSPAAAGEVVSAIVHASADGSRVYFNATGRLLSGQGSESGENLYFADEGGLHFLAPVGSADPLQISQDGDVALLDTAVPLEAADTDERRDVYLYSAGSATFTRISSGVSSGNGYFDAKITSPVESQVVLFGSGATYRALTEDGQRAFFSSAEQLVSEDQNEASDVYEWAEGELGLVSSGSGNVGADFAGASADGQTVLFKTAALLLPSDRDGGARDLYAARIGGGFPVKDAPPPECATGACPATRGQRLIRSVPASITPESGKPGRLVLLHIDRRAGESVSLEGQLKVKVRVPAPGLVTGSASMRFNGKSRTAAHGSAGAIRAGTLTVSMRVTPAARQALRQRHALQLRLVLHQANLRLVRELTLRLSDPR